MEADQAKLGSQARSLVSMALSQPILGLEDREAIAEALYQKGERYYSSPSVAHGDMKQIRKALKCYLSASDLGHIPAHYKVGYIYDCFVNKPALAFYYFKIAADAGDIPSQSCVGFMYFHGRGVDRNIIEAFRYTKSAAAKGYLSALMQLGLAYQYYPDVNISLLMAVGYYYAALQNIWASRQPNQYQVEGVVKSLDDLLCFKEVNSRINCRQDVEKLITREIDLFEGIFFCMCILTGRLQKKIRFYSESDCIETNSNIDFIEFAQKYSDLKEALDDVVPLVTKVYGGTVPGFAVRCVQPTPALFQDFNMKSTVLESVQYEGMGFYLLQMNNKLYSCIGGNNPQIGYTLDRKFKEINSSLTEIDTILQRLNSSEKLDSQSKLTKKAYRDFISIKKFVVRLQEGLMLLIEITTPIRDEEFVIKNSPLFF